jgi:hypothetical protein
VIPDVAVEITPEDWAKGIDSQLRKAVEVVTSDVREWKAKKNGDGANTGTTSTTTPMGSGNTAPASIPKASPSIPPAQPKGTLPPMGRIPLAE